MSLDEGSGGCVERWVSLDEGEGRGVWRGGCPLMRGGEGCVER